MSAVNAKALQDVIGEIYVAPKSNLTAVWKDDMSTSAALITELGALTTFERMASVTELSLAVNLADEVFEAKADDTGTLKKYVRPSIRITGNWFEAGNVNTLKIILGVNSATITGTPPAKNAVNWGLALTTKSVPELIVKIVTQPDEDGLIKTIYLYNSSLSGELVFSFLDVVENQNLPGSSFELAGNKGGFVLFNDQRIATQA